MIRFRLQTLACASLSLLCYCIVACNRAHELSFFEIPSLEDPDVPGCELGVSAMFTANMDGNLIIAGGCNFPEEPASKGGRKRYYSAIWSCRMDNPEKGWKKIGEMDTALGYGGSVTVDGRAFFIGGTGENGPVASVSELVINDGVAELIPATPLDGARDNFATCSVDERIVVVGGNRNGIPCRDLLLWDPNSSDGWKIVSVIPDGPRLQPVCSSYNGCIYIFGGYDPGEIKEEARVSDCGLKYDIAKDEWERITMPLTEDGPLFLGGGVCVDLNGKFICTSGVNAEVFGKAIRGEYDGKGYLDHVEEWYRFNGYIFEYDPAKEKWSRLGMSMTMARAGAGVIVTDDGFILINGEIKPGIRTSTSTKVMIK